MSGSAMMTEVSTPPNAEHAGLLTASCLALVGVIPTRDKTSGDSSYADAHLYRPCGCCLRNWAALAGAFRAGVLARSAQRVSDRGRYQLGYSCIPIIEAANTTLGRQIWAQTLTRCI